jgi:hypothetical protein
MRFSVLALVMLCAPASARADWLLIPFAGTGFGTETSFRALGGANSKTVFGVSGGWLGDGLIGFEGDLLYGLGFFERGGDTVTTGSFVSTLSGGVIIAVPLAVTQESLRPYLTGGVGTVHVSIDDLIDLRSVSRQVASMHLGGGAIGFVSPRTGFRFDVRHVRSLRRELALTGLSRSQLSFWRLSVGVVIRLG